MKTKEKSLVAAKTKLFVLELETRHFSFQCFAETKEECYDHFWDAWMAHCRRCAFDVEESLFPTRSSLTRGEYADDLKLIQIRSFPVCLRDGEEIKV